MINVSRERLLLAIVIFFVAFSVIGIMARYVVLSSAVEVYEDVSLSLFPSAPRAYSYGERHFSAQSASSYDIDRSEYFFNETRRMDPQHLFVFHQLARVAFLKGDFARARALADAQIRYHGDATPSSHYVRALIEGFMGDYDASIKDYEIFLASHPSNWAALNDYAWVLLKANRPQDAEKVTAEGLKYFPDNPWLLNSYATVLYELGYYHRAFEYVQKASVTLQDLTEEEWLHAYPGNDPKIAAEGIAAFKKAIAENMHTIELVATSSTVQSR